eukprot:gene26293-biopygen15607
MSRGFARDQQLRFHLDSGREHFPPDISSSENGHYYDEIDACCNDHTDMLQLAS